LVCERWRWHRGNLETHGIEAEVSECLLTCDFGEILGESDNVELTHVWCQVLFNKDFGSCYVASYRANGLVRRLALLGCVPRMGMATWFVFAVCSARVSET
jgi:hypothetical protein